MKILAHRGVSAHFHENTLLAFEKSLELGVWGIEVDLHQVGSEFAIFHDFSLDRLVNIRSDLADLSTEQLSQVKLKNGDAIPMLSDLFALVKGQCMLNLELKYINDPQQLVDDITAYINTYSGEIIVSSFNHPLLLTIRQLIRNTRIEHKIKFGALIAHLPHDLAKYAVDMQADIAAIAAELVSEEFVADAHLHHIEVWSYTVNHEKQCRALDKMGVDAVFSNDPAFISSIVEDKQ